MTHHARVGGRTDPAPERSERVVVGGLLKTIDEASPPGTYAPGLIKVFSFIKTKKLIFFNIRSQRKSELPHMRLLYGVRFIGT